MLGFALLVALSACKTEFPQSDGEPDCESYCTTISETCTGDMQQYGTTQQCLDVCATLTPGSVDDDQDNTVGCRLHYANEAAEDPEGFCRAAGPGGDEICGGDCQGFCQIQSEACVGDDEQFANNTDCISACTNFDDSVPYSSNVVDGDSRACRLYHLTVAATNPEVHCPHITADSPVCL